MKNPYEVAHEAIRGVIQKRLPPRQVGSLSQLMEVVGKIPVQEISLRENGGIYIGSQYEVTASPRGCRRKIVAQVLLTKGEISADLEAGLKRISRPNLSVFLIEVDGSRTLLRPRLPSL